jgi:hypothetical protein
VTVTLRHSDISGAVDRIEDPSGLFDEPGNIGHAREDELALDVTAPLDRLFISNGLIKTTATWRDTRVTDPTTGMARPLSQIHPLDWRLEFTQDLNALRSTWGVSVIGGNHEGYWRYGEIDQFKLGDWVQASYEYKPTSTLAIRLELNNLTSRPLEQTYTVFAANRPSPIDYIDWRAEHSGREIHLRLRKTLG